MYLGYTEEQGKLRREPHSYHEGLLTPEVEVKLAGDGGVGPAIRRVVRQIGEDGRQLELTLGGPRPLLQPGAIVADQAV